MNTRSNNLEENALEKDTTPYLIFVCKKCQQFSYVKASQKTKKCLRCGRSHQVRSLLNEGEIVSGMSLAVNTVKQKQNELAIPEFRSQNDFIINTKGAHNNNNNLSRTKCKTGDEEDYDHKFKLLLLELAKLYEKFPSYMIEIMAENSGISSQEIPLLIKKFKKNGFLTLVKNEEFYYELTRDF